MFSSKRARVTSRRFRVGFDPEYFARRGGAASIGDVFRHAWQANLWGGAESPSGPGSSLDQTARLRAELPALCTALGVRTLLDLPCGDCHWMSAVTLPGVAYLGADLLPELVARNQSRHGAPGRGFSVLDLPCGIIGSPLPSADLLLVRDCLVHLSFADAARALANIRRSAITWLLATTFPAQDSNEDIVTGDWRPINLCLAPYNLPAPERLINEGCSEQDGLFADKSLGLWRVADLPSP